MIDLILEGIIMTTKWEKQEGNKGVLTFEVSSEEFDQALDQAFKKYQRMYKFQDSVKGRFPRYF